MSPARSKAPRSASTAGQPLSSRKASSNLKRRSKDDETYGTDAPADEDIKEYDSDALDDDSEEDVKKTKKRKRVSASANKTTRASPKKRKVDASDGDEDEFELKEGQEVVGIVVQAPKTGRVPAGQISQNTLDFLSKLKDPECNDRDWFKLHEPVYRQAEQEWKDFIDAFTELLTEVDSQVPPLPPKDVIYRIYRDVRFSNDKTPYKKSLSAYFSRSGRKGIFAGSQVSELNKLNLASASNTISTVEPGGESVIAAGSWQPGKNELATIRDNIVRNPRRLRQIISAPDFVRHFGAAEPRSDGVRQNIFGMEDELKVAPKGVDKSHKDIDLLKCRTFMVARRFTDQEVLAPDFKNVVATMAEVMRPFVHCLNDMMTLTSGGDLSGEENDVEGDDEDE